ncbi:MAG: class I SAM-dependent methyltransferase [Pseudomonadota bacterium]
MGFLIQSVSATDQELDAATFTLPPRVNIDDTRFIRPYMGELKNDPASLRYVESIISNCFTQRPVGNSNKYGYVFPLNPEILTYLMSTVRGKSVLEIGGASGESSIMLALAGAERVYVNDITREEVDIFEQHKRNAPQIIKDKLESILGNCLDLLTLKPELQGRCQIVLCRNVFHFLKDADRPRFFEMLTNVLAPGGQIIFTTNCIRPNMLKGELGNTLIQNPHQTRFSVATYALDIPGERIPSTLHSNTSLCEEDLDPLEFKVFSVYKKENKERSTWLSNATEIKKLSISLQHELSAVIKNHTERLKTVNSGEVRVVQNVLRALMPAALADIFKEQGFVIQKTFGIDRDGHTITAMEDKDLITEVDHQPSIINQVGIIARLN